MKRIFPGLTAALLLATPAEAACRLALALALDVSGSVDAREYRLQLDGVAAALVAPEVQNAFFSQPGAQVEIAVYQWGAPWQQRILLDWTAVTSVQTLDRISLRLRNTSVTFKDPSTAIGSAMEFGIAMLSDRPDCWLRTLDISGDGPSNWGPHPDRIARGGAGDFITINGLVVNPEARDNIDKDLTEVTTLLEYYEAYVIRGPQGFVEIARDFDDFERAMTRKLTRELATVMVSEAGTKTYK